ncbi:MAG: DedA family protein [Nanoarchaeota archaeon]|nr:DedA family protein [Nanoarchaeota archaeon]MBU4300415.1 DedA family protein [Nanoarchaeota archaeon]MBU4451367.1 DedA family protein [Nanoarchaeota archaeon]MCG2723770.1 DedA family protein [archaeon]
MEPLSSVINIILHLDIYLNQIVLEYKSTTYAILFLIIFLETGFVATPFLPGDSLLFAAGAIAALGSLNPFWLIVLLSIAAILGDNMNYWIGRHAGSRLYSLETRFIKKEHFDKTQQFYEKHGGKTIILARFLPIIRTFAPFVAGIGKMSYSRFLEYNVIGGIVWVALFISAGYYFGNIPIIKQNFTMVIMAIIVITMAPAVIGFLKHYRKQK